MRLIFLLSAIYLCSACSHHVSIESINHNQFRDRAITVAGRVANSFIDGNASVFELDDGTGRLWVFRDNTNLPAHNSSISITGKIEQGFPFAGRNFVIILRETQEQD